MEWPGLDYESWKETYETFHRWTQIIGKVRLSLEPWQNHSWSSTLYVTPEGLWTSAMPAGQQVLSIEFNLIHQLLSFRMSDGRSLDLPLRSESVAEFYYRVMKALSEFGVKVHFDPRPNELSDNTPFRLDQMHRAYNPQQIRTFWQILVRVNNVLKEFRAKFVGKCSPVHFFWGSFDLAVTRFSGRRAPVHPGGVPHLADRVVREAYSHEVSSCGFWPGNEIYPQAAFYSYAYPEPARFSQADILPAEAFYHETLREWLLPYNDVRNSTDPEAMVMRFCQSTYAAAAGFGRWNRELLEQSPHFFDMRRMTSASETSST